MVRRNRFITGACVAALMPVLSLAPASAQTLKEALELTYATNPALKAQRAGLRATDELGAQSRAAGRPTLNGQVSYEKADGDYDPGRDLSELFGGGEGDGNGGDGSPPPDNNDLGEALTGNGGAGSKQIGVVVEQNLFQGFRVKNSIEQSDAQIDAAQAQLVATEQALLLQTVAAYLGVVTAQETVAYAETSLNLLTRQQELANVRFDSGQATKTDVAQADARYAQANATLIRARADLASSRARFEQVTGQMPGTLESDPALPPLPDTMDEARMLAMEFNPDVIAAREQERASALGIKIAKGYLAPTVTAKATYGYAENQFIDGDRSENATISAQITVPFYQGGASWSGIRRAREANRADHYALIDAERQARTAAETAWLQMQAARAAYEATVPALDASELAYEGLTLEGELGQRSTLDVLDGESELFRVRLERLQAREAYQLAAYQLLQATGQLTANTLGLDVDYYDPDINRRDVAGRWFGLGTETE